MAKFNRTGRAPAGAHEPLRNVRLYGGRDEQIEGLALRSKGQPDPRYRVLTRKRADLVRESEERSHRAHQQRAQVRMLQAQDAVREARRYGRPYAALAQEARAARAAYLKLTDGVERRTVEVDMGSDANKVKAV